MQAKMKDVDSQTGKINILNSKRDVGRRIVVSSSLLEIMQKYYNDYCTGYTRDEWFIQNSRGGDLLQGHPLQTLPRPA